MIQTYDQFLEGSLRIVFDYLKGTNELGDLAAATRFLIDNIETTMKRGERPKLLLFSGAIDVYRHRQTRREIALVSRVTQR
jgi:hypothetical protein